MYPEMGWLPAAPPDVSRSMEALDQAMLYFTVSRPVPEEHATVMPRLVPAPLPFSQRPGAAWKESSMKRGRLA